MALSMAFDGKTQTFSRVFPTGSNAMSSAAHFSAEGRKARARNRGKRDPNQVEFTELPGGDKDLPF